MNERTQVDGRGNMDISIHTHGQWALCWGVIPTAVAMPHCQYQSQISSLPLGPCPCPGRGPGLASSLPQCTQLPWTCQFVHRPTDASSLLGCLSIWWRRATINLQHCHCHRLTAPPPHHLPSSRNSISRSRGPLYVFSSSHFECKHIIHLNCLWFFLLFVSLLVFIVTAIFAAVAVAVISGQAMRKTEGKSGFMLEAYTPPLLVTLNTKILFSNHICIFLYHIFSHFFFPLFYWRLTFDELKMVCIITI